MTAEAILTRLRGRLTGEAFRGFVSRLVGRDLHPSVMEKLADHMLDALRPECEAIAREMAELRNDLNTRQFVITMQRNMLNGLNNQVADDYDTRARMAAEVKLQAAESSRVALRQALQRLVNEMTAHVGPFIPQRLEDARNAAEALLAHEPTPVSPSD